MAATATPGPEIVLAKPRFPASNRILGSRIAYFGRETKGSDQTKLSSLSLSATHLFSKSYNCNLLKSERHVVKAMSGKRAFIAGIADDNGYGWAIAKSLAAAGAEILVGTWVPALNIFETSLRRGKFDESRVLPDGSLMEITKVYPLDAVFDCPEDVPDDEVAETVKQDFGTIDILVHSLANGPEVIKPLLETSRNGYLAAISAYGGGMSSAKSALESPLRSRAAKAIGFIDMMIDYSLENAPLQKELTAEEVGNAAAFLASPLASAITGAVVYVDNGLNAMGVGVDSPVFRDLDIPKANKN
ncbi:enoyl-[acyl-carrier-protein] reductase [nadh] chloroplastic [Phtheirospermum japonicum]|uniref:Enoyl-[acyl-carrier-protein] reductase [nadh] chloroplastic n=1 Tax=Phtheirospermum japonicum TaxID=374723 RepID=A0A830C482_9LAMI|nr:enoyl-[acyl-carrier-protein] reductase [nadh] chloroplastic [Phtheirospermum japonicum]